MTILKNGVGCLFLCVAVGASAALAGAQQPLGETGQFAFRAERSRGVPVTLAAADGVTGIVWPETADAERWDTALLGVRVTADTAIESPYVEVTSGEISDRQYFRSGDAGERWLNLTFARGVRPGARIAIHGEGVAIDSPVATLRLFSAGLDLSKTILVLAPHPDDAEIAAFGLYAHRNATVVTVTAGNAGAPTYEAVFDDPAEQYLFKGRIRLIDSITVPFQGGIPPERTFNMGYFDARLAEMYDKREAVVPEMYRPNADVNVYRKENVGKLLPKRPRESRWEHLVEDVVTLLKKVKPAIVVAPHPQLDSHRDHQFTTVALSEALERWDKRVALLLYTNHADRNQYPYGPAGTLMSLPPPPSTIVPVDGIYSHPVPLALQRLKLFALESMHDLRFTPTRQYQLGRTDLRAVAPEKTGPEPDITYLRRGPRSNELFYVYDRDGFTTMVKQFLAERSPQ